MQPGQQFGKVKGLGHVIVGTGLQARYPVVQCIAGREQEHRHCSLGLAQLLQNGQAIAHGQADVQYGDVEMLLLQQIVGHGPVGGVFYIKPGFAQLVLQGIGQHGIVFSKQQFHARSLMDC